MPQYDLTPEYDALYDDNQDLFDDEEYAKLKKAGRLPEGAETKISPEAIVKALENLDYDNASRVDEKERLRNKNWYPDGGVESDAVKKSKYGDLPEKMPYEPSITEDEPLEMGDMWDPKVSDADRAKDKEYAKRMYGESDNDPENIDELFGDTEKKPDVSITKTTVSKPEQKNKPSGDKPKAPTSMSKEKVELSADTLRPKEKKSSLWDDEGEGIKFEGPEDKAKKEFQGKLEKDYEGVPFGEKGIEESSDPFGVFAPAEHVSPGDFLKDTAETALLGAAGGRALKGLGKYAGSKLGKLFGKAEGRAPKIDLTPGEKVPSMSEVGPGNIWESNAKMAKGHGDDLMFRGVEGAEKSKTKFGKGVTGRRLNLTEKGTGDTMANRSSAPDIAVMRKEVPGLRSEVLRNEGKFGRTSITQSDMKRLTQQLSQLVSSGRLTREKYAGILKGLGRNPSEISAELARAFP